MQGVQYESWSNFSFYRPNKLLAASTSWSEKNCGFSANNAASDVHMASFML